MKEGEPKPSDLHANVLATQLDRLETQARRIWDLSERASARSFLEEKQDSRASEIEAVPPGTVEAEISSLRNEKKVIRDALNTPATFAKAIDFLHTLSYTETFEYDTAEIIANNIDVIREHLNGHQELMGTILTLLLRVYFVAVRDFTESDLPKTPTSKIRDAVRDVLPAIRAYIRENEEGGDIPLNARFSLLKDLHAMFDTNPPSWLRDEIGDVLARSVMSGHLMRAMFHERSMRNVDALSIWNVEMFLELLELRHVRAILGRAFEIFGLPLHAYIDDAGLTMISDKWAPHVHYFLPAIEQLTALRDLEKERPGCAKILYERFGVRWFSRYPLKVLIDQYDERDNADAKYGIFMVALHDDSGGFFSENDRNVVASIHTQLKALGYKLRVIESGGKHDARGRLEQFKTLYGERNVVPLLALRSHSSKNHMELGRGDDGDLDMVDFLPGGALHQNIFSNGTTLLLDGCAVGRKTGVGRAASQIFGTVLAPKGVQSALKEVSIEKVGDAIQCGARYYVGERDEELAARVYRGGRERN